MNDFQLIKDLKGLNSERRLRKLRREGALAAVMLKHQLKLATESAQQVVIATHIPPFRESCWYDGGHSDDDWAPFFCCGAVGWMIRRFAASYPAHRFIVICGHTHHSGRSKIMDNLWTWTGAADYGTPKLADIIQDSPSPFDAKNDYCFASKQ